MGISVPVRRTHKANANATDPNCVRRGSVFQNPLLSASRITEDELLGAERSLTDAELVERDELVEFARWHCYDCPLLASCLKTALRSADTAYSITAGLTYRQVKRLRTDAGLPAAISPIRRNLAETYAADLERHDDDFAHAWRDVDQTLLAAQWADMIALPGVPVEEAAERLTQRLQQHPDAAQRTAAVRARARAQLAQRRHAAAQASAAHPWTHRQALTEQVPDAVLRRVRAAQERHAAAYRQGETLFVAPPDCYTPPPPRTPRPTRARSSSDHAPDLGLVLFTVTTAA